MISTINATGTTSLASFLGATFLGVTLMIIISALIIWSLIWKGIALWKAARNDSPVWFIVMLVLNTCGILEILYIFIFSKRKSKKMSEKEIKNKHEN